VGLDESLKDFEEELEKVYEDDAGREALEEIEKKESEKAKEHEEMQPVELKKTMIFAVPLKTKSAATVEVVIKEIVVYIERKNKHKVERVHTDPGSELQTHSLKARCAQNNFQKDVDNSRRLQRKWKR
jgi:hypothetical protein